MSSDLCPSCNGCIYVGGCNCNTMYNYYNNYGPYAEGGGAGGPGFHGASSQGGDASSGSGAGLLLLFALVFFPLAVIWLIVRLCQLYKPAPPKTDRTQRLSREEKVGPPAKVSVAPQDYRKKWDDEYLAYSKA